MPHCDDCGTWVKSLIPVGVAHMMCDGCAEEEESDNENDPE